MSDVYAGSICGTSLDGIDVALVEFPTDASAHVLAYASVPLSAELSAAMRAIVFNGAPCDALTYGQLDQKFGIAIAHAVLRLMGDAEYSARHITALGSHGINLLHAPDEDVPVSLQIGDPNQIARLTGVTTVADFRRRDVALGGQGAPLAPAFHAAVLSDPQESRVVLNLGGIANITVLQPGREVTGFDTGPANGLLDAWFVLHHHDDGDGQTNVHGQTSFDGDGDGNSSDNRADSDDAFDRNGAWAAGGNVVKPLLDALANDSYFLRSPPKSTGKEHFNLAWLQRHVAALSDKPAAQDVQTTLAELTAQTVCASILSQCPTTATLLVCGGGVHNENLIQRLKRGLPNVTVASTEAFGVAPDHVEAAAFAWLAKRTLNRESGNLSSVTGASENSVLGGIYYP